jgi:hypothetical protein
MRSPEEWVEIWVESIRQFSDENADIIESDTADKKLNELIKDLIHKIQRDGQLDGRIDGMLETLTDIENGVPFFDLIKKVNHLQELNATGN